VQFRILGPLEVGNGQRGVAIETPKLRALLGVLLLHPNEVVSSERLIDELWGERPPATAPKLVQTYVSQLRRELGPGTIETRAPGYLVPLGENELDSSCFRRLAGEGRRLAAGGDREAAGRVYREALSLWRGPPLADVLFESFARNEVDQLEEERLGSRMDLIDCELELGRHADVVPELETLVRQHPVRERLRAQLMLALYRSGRQVEALAVYQDVRRELVEELGLEPAAELQTLERQILTHDPALELPAKELTGTRAASAPRLRDRPAAAIGAVVGLAVAVLLAFVLVDRGHASVQLGPDHVGFIDPTSDRVTRSIQVGRGPRALALGFGSVWVADYRNETITRIDRRTGRTTTIPVGGHPTGLVAYEGTLWVWTLEGNLVPFDPRYDEPGAPVSFARELGPARSVGGGIAAGDGFLWIASAPTTVIRVDPTHPRARPRLIRPNEGVEGAIGYREGTVWVAGADQVFPIATKNTPDTAATTGVVRDLAFGAGSLWVLSGGVGHVGGVVQALRRIDPQTGDINQIIPVGSDPVAVAFAAGSVWVASGTDRTVYHVRPGPRPLEDKVVDTIHVGANPTALAADAHGLWIAGR
jgi:DNA-binding SARP family transcriptional activator/DNA-binding beta-propeller fold protein YncE